MFAFDHFHWVFTEHNDPLDALLASTDLPWLDLFVPTSEVFLAFLFRLTKSVNFSIKTSKTPVAAVGNVFGLRYKSRAELTGGIILILMGCKILLEHLGILSF